MAAAWVYPFLLVASFYLTWLVAWGILGHAPRPSLDDPKFISSWLDVPYDLTALLLIGFPAAALGGVVATAWFGSIRRLPLLTTLLMAVSLLGLWLAAVALLRWDPLEVVNWFFD